MIMMTPPRTIVFRRPRRSPIHKLERAPTRHPISCTKCELRDGTCGDARRRTYVNGDHEALKRWVHTELREHFLELARRR